MKNVLMLAVQIKTKAFPGELGKGDIVGGLELNINRLLGIFHQHPRVPESGGGDFHGPDFHGLAGGKLAGGAVDGLGIKLCSPIDPVAGF